MWAQDGVVPRCEGMGAGMMCGEPMGADAAVWGADATSVRDPSLPFPPHPLPRLTAVRAPSAIRRHRASTASRSGAVGSDEAGLDRRLSMTSTRTSCQGELQGGEREGEEAHRGGKRWRSWREAGACQGGAKVRRGGRAGGLGDCIWLRRAACGGGGHFLTAVIVIVGSRHLYGALHI